MIVETILRNPIVDTGPLFDFLLWRFSDSLNIKTSRLRYLNTDLYKKSTHWYLTIAKPKTCPEVIAEIHRHALSSLKGRRLGEFWRFAQQELITLGLSEQLVTVAEMDSQTLSSLGPTDTALLQIASTAPDSSQPVMTEDTHLAGQCRKKQVKVLRITDVVGMWQQFGSKQGQERREHH